ncbi:MAG: DnaB-like helicase C-terminal domain-containing protein, partial [Mycoplasmataceae bacterium]|nr:DnaB-like helicase C-terminal domain-containing protein [Mycoplasmataceae bacterium]
HHGNRQQEVSKISRSLKQLARELDVPIIALSQLNRRVEERESKKPMMSDLRESGSIEQDADIIGFLYREDYYNKNKEEVHQEKHLTELNIAKHRNGSIGTIEFLFDSSTGKFTTFKNEDN